MNAELLGRAYSIDVLVKTYEDLNGWGAVPERDIAVLHLAHAAKKFFKALDAHGRWTSLMRDISLAAAKADATAQITASEDAASEGMRARQQCGSRRLLAEMQEQVARAYADFERYPPMPEPKGRALPDLSPPSLGGLARRASLPCDPPRQTDIHAHLRHDKLPPSPFLRSANAQPACREKEYDRLRIAVGYRDPILAQLRAAYSVPKESYQRSRLHCCT